MGRGIVWVAEGPIWPSNQSCGQNLQGHLEGSGKPEEGNMVQASIVNSAIPQGIILVYDITDEKSFENIQNWMKSIKEVRTVPERWGNWVEPRG